MMNLMATVSTESQQGRGHYADNQLISTIHYKRESDSGVVTDFAVSVRVTYRKNGHPFVSIVGNPNCTFEIGAVEMRELKRDQVDDPKQGFLFDPQL